MTARRGLFVCFEGVDGAGTTTQAALLHQRIVTAGHSSWQTAEPSTGPIGRLVREYLRGEQKPLDPVALALLFVADRREHVQRWIEPALSTGINVVADRYEMSTTCYQNDVLAPELLSMLHDGLPSPSLTILLDLPWEVARDRRRSRGARAELFEDDVTQARVAELYRNEAALTRAAGARVLVVDASQPVEQVAAWCWEAVEALLPPVAVEEARS